MTSTVIVPPSTFSAQNTLPRLPVPRLEETCALYLKSIVPLQTAQEHEKTKKIVADFLKSDIAKSLQQRLIDLDRMSPTNWLEDNFWLEKAYLEWREPLMVNSNWYVLIQQDAHHPKQLLSNNGVQPSGRFSRFQIQRAAHLIHRCLLYKEMVERQDLPIDMMKDGKAQCMWQYSRIYSVTRIPFYNCDKLIQADPKNVHHIIVLLRDQVYKLNVYKELEKDIWTLMTVEEIESALLASVAHVENLVNPSAAIPLLTSWQRDNWAIARNHLLSISPSVHRHNLNTIESALFAVSLDDHSNGTDAASWTKTAFCGHQALGNGHNRWFDKSFTLAVENNGMCAFSGEHSPVDAYTVSLIFDYALQVPTGLRDSNKGHSHEFIHASETPQQAPYIVLEHLPFTADNTLTHYLSQAQIAADTTSALSDSNVLIFKDYGTTWVKKTARVPPDAFYQMTLQAAYYRIHGKFTATYETASTRKFLRGRTETIRTLSTDSVAFVKALDDATLSDHHKYQLLVKATHAHRAYTQIASDGKGCDRHLFALRLLNASHQIMGSSSVEKAPMHAIFTDPVFTESQTWRLSTSGLHEGIRLMGTGFGSVYRDGYGVNYMAAPTLVKFGVESKRVPETVSTNDFIKAIEEVLRDLKTLCENVNLDSGQVGELCKL